MTSLPGFNLRPTDHLVTTTRNTGRWNVSFVQRDPGELFLYGTTLASDPAVAGWVERVDPVTLEPLASTGDLPAGGHEWPGGVAVHRNGDLYMVSGGYMHRVAPNCEVLAALPMPIDHAHNGLLILDDGSILTKDIRVGEGAEPSTLTVCDPDLAVLATAAVPEPSLGRLAVVGDYIYVPGSTRIFRYRWTGSSLEMDAGWAPQYREADSGGVAGDLAVADGRVWFMDNADVPSVVQRLLPSGGADVAGGRAGNGGPNGQVSSWGEAGAPGWDTPVRAIGIRTDDDSDIVSINATELPSGWAVAPPLVHDGVLMAWDTGGMGMAAFDIGGSEATPEMLWFQPFRTSMRPLLFANTGELVINDYRILDSGRSSDDLVVLDLETGTMKARVPSGDSEMAGVFMTPGAHQTLYFCATEVITRVSPG
ncbi:MAG: hypothetical protein AAF531_18725 [Actinomycetota bacterium]